MKDTKWISMILEAAEDAVDGYESYLRDTLTSLQLAKIMKKLKNLLTEEDDNLNE